MKKNSCSISITLILTLLFSQISWSGEVMNKLNDVDSPSGTMSAQNLAESQSAVESLVNAKNAAIAVPDQSSIVSVESGDYRLFLQERMSDGTLGAKQSYVIKGVNWSPASAGTTQSGLMSEFIKWYQTDIPLMAQMGVNTVRVFHDFGTTADAIKILDKFYEYGIKVIMTVDSPDPFTSGSFLNITSVVNAYKDHPAILMWEIGNEWDVNNYYGRFSDLLTSAKFTEQAAILIKSLDPNHPVATICADPHIPEIHPLSAEAFPFEVSADTITMSDIVNDIAPSVDVWGFNVYRDNSFGDLFTQWRSISDKPMFIGEFGADSYDHSIGKSGAENQPMQADMNGDLWDEVYFELSAERLGGTTLGALSFEWNDEWWKDGSSSKHNRSNEMSFGQPDFYTDEEWFGLVDINRKPKESFFALQRRYLRDSVTLDPTPLISIYSSTATSSSGVEFDIGDKIVFSRLGGMYGGRGITVMVLDDCTGIGIKDIRTFDTWYDANISYTYEAHRELVAYLDSLPSGSVVAFAIGDEGGLTSSANVNVQSLYEEIESFGSTKIRSVTLWSKWAMIAVKGGDVLAEAVAPYSGDDTALEVRAELSVTLNPDRDKYPSLPDKPVYKFYPNGFIESKTLTTPDHLGNIYYHYTNDSTGRIDITKRAVADENGVMACKITYSSKYPTRISKKDYYSDGALTVLKSACTYYSDSANNLESVTLTTPDSLGNIYYHYTNDSNGRVDITKRAVADENGAMACKITYSSKYPTRIVDKKYYSDSKMSKLVYTVTYYNDATNLQESKTLTTPDSLGNIYYHYINENWNNQGYGRVDKSKRKTALDGELSHTYSYYSDSTGKLKEKKGYSSNKWSTLKSTYCYYNDSGNRLESKTLTTPDSLGNIYYHYINENWNNQGYGRVDKSKRKTALNGELSCAYSYYSDSNGRLHTKQVYSDNNWASLISTNIYYNDSNNRQESKTLATPDSLGNIYYHYINENWNKQVYGRIDRSKREIYLNGEFSCTYNYYPDSNGRLCAKQIYSDDSWTTLVSTNTYYNNSGNRLESKTLTTPDSSGNIYYHYIDSSGERADIIKRETMNGEGVIAYKIKYSGSTTRVINEECYSDSALTVLKFTRTYYNNKANRLESITLVNPDSSGNIYYHYINDATGRVDITKRSTADENGAVACKITYCSKDPMRIASKKYYSDSKMSKLVYTVKYYNDSNNRQESKTFKTPDPLGNIYYHYINEDWNNQGYGRVDVIIPAK